MAKTIYDLGLNEYLVVEEQGNERTTVTRVPGGWIYTFSGYGLGDDGSVSVSNSSVFVPLNKEFEQKAPLPISGFQKG